MQPPTLHPPNAATLPCLVVVILYMSLQSILVETKWWSCCRGEGPIDCGGWACTGVTMQSIYLNFKQKRRSKPSLSVTIWTPLHLWGYCVTRGHVFGVYKFLSDIIMAYFMQGRTIGRYAYLNTTPWKAAGRRKDSTQFYLGTSWVISLKHRTPYHWYITNHYPLNSGPSEIQSRSGLFEDCK